jgi:FtsP/CotA-like multicopper oxidase with cupredoxin domain
MMQNGQMMEGRMMSGSGAHMMPDGTMMGNTEAQESQQSDIEWEDTMPMMNSMSTSHTILWKITDKDTGAINDAILWNFKVGDVAVISIVNDPKSMHAMQHPIHFHGQRFIVLSTNGIPSTDFVWKDTTLVKRGDTVKIALELSNPGLWMAHCHIAEHLSDGMMFNFNVNER